MSELQTALAEVFPIAAGTWTDLALVLRANCRRAVGVICRSCHTNEGDLTDFHPGIQRDRKTGNVGKFERELPVPSSVDKPRCRMDEQSKTAERRLAFEASDEIGGKPNALTGGTEDEFTRMQHERVVWSDLNEFGEIFEVLLHVDVAHRVIPKHPEKSVDMKVDRRWLDTTGIERLDNDAAGFDLFTDGAVREDHGSAG